MTIDEFIEALKETPRNWQNGGSGIRAPRLRTDDEIGCYDCPLTAVAKVAGCDSVSGLADWNIAARFLGIPAPVAKSITRAADGDEPLVPLNGVDEVELRAKMFAACGLQPETAPASA